MFRFIEAEGWTVQPGIKKAYYSQGTFLVLQIIISLKFLFLLIRENYHRIFYLSYSLRILSILVVNASGHAHKNISETPVSAKKQLHVRELRLFFTK